MPDGSERRGPRGAAAWLVGIALFFNLWILADTLIGLARGGLLGAEEALFVVYGVHVAASIYEGRFGLCRSLSWLALTGAFFVLTVTSFHGYMPSLWSPLFRAVVAMRDAHRAGALVSNRRAMALAATFLILLDVMLAHAPRLARWPWRRSAVFLLGIAALEAVSIAGAAYILPQDATQAGVAPADDLQPLREQPFFALLFAPDWPQNIGLTVVLTVAALPMLAPLQRAWRFHATPTIAVWTALCAALVASWIGLVAVEFLYLRPQALVMAMAAYQYVFFLAAPPLLGRLARRGAPKPATVFD